MKAFLFGFLLILANCAAWDYAGALQTCVDNHIGDPQGREQCICQTAADAGRSCAFLEAGADLDGGVQ